MCFYFVSGSGRPNNKRTQSSYHYLQLMIVSLARFCIVLVVLCCVVLCCVVLCCVVLILLYNLDLEN
jgi:hypothetical protein